MESERSCKSGKRTAVLIAVVAMLFAIGLSAGCGKAQGQADNDLSSPEATSAPWSPSSDCTKCHAVEAKSVKDSSALVSQHATQGLTCSTCHSDEATLKSLHDKASTGSSAPAKLSATAVESAICTKCHDPQQLIADAAPNAALTDDTGKVVNPHELPVNQSHTDAGIVCTSCHQMHVSNSDSAATAMDLCVGCHHKKVFECGTCHS